MSFVDDTCDFCGAEFDPMGNDLARMVTVPGVPGEKSWDGQCLQGMEAQWSHHSVTVLERLADKYQALYDADPIDHDWSQPQHQGLTELERFRIRIRQCEYCDLAWQLRHYANHRKEQDG